MTVKPICEIIIKTGKNFWSGYLLTAAALITLSCNQPKAPPKIEFFYVRPEVRILTDQMTIYNQVDGPAVGYAGDKTIQWQNYEKLTKLAYSDELRELTRDRNPVVRCYAFDALAARKDTGTFTLLLRHVQDTALVQTFRGCSKYKEMTGDYFIRSVKPYDSDDTGYKMSVKQRAVVDSILLFDKQVKLATKYELLEDLKPQLRYYKRIREIAVSEKAPQAKHALARYNKPEDLTILSK